MGLFSRKISLEANGETIKVSAGLGLDMDTFVLKLYVNDVLQDTLSIKLKDGFLGCNRCLVGYLQNNVPLRVQLRSHFFMKPQYTFYVNGVVVHFLKGTWAGL